jgi:hypothetical protein
MSRIQYDYVSDHTQFINEELKKNPQWRTDQQTGRSIWWDKPQDVKQNEIYAEAKVAQKSYPYDVLFDS